MNHHPSPHFSRQQIRVAILRAADTIAPANYNFWDCGLTNGCGCMLVHIGRALRVTHFDNNAQDAVGPIVASCLTSETRASDICEAFYREIKKTANLEDALEVATALRAYADRYFPAEQAAPLDAAYLKLRAGLPALARQFAAENKPILAAVVSQECER